MKTTLLLFVLAATIGVTIPEDLKKKENINLGGINFENLEELEGSKEVMEAVEGMEEVAKENCSTCDRYFLFLLLFPHHIPRVQHVEEESTGPVQHQWWAWLVLVLVLVLAALLLVGLCCSCFLPGCHWEEKKEEEMEMMEQAV